MIERLLLVAWKGSQSVGWAETFRASGYTVLVEETTGERAWRTAKERGIDCVVIDGDKKPSLGRQTGYQLRDTAKTREIPIVWANLNPDEASLVQSEVRPDVTLPRPTDASEVIAAIESLAMAQEARALALRVDPPPVPAAAARTTPPVAKPARPVAASKTARAKGASKAKVGAKKPVAKAKKKTPPSGTRKAVVRSAKPKALSKTRSKAKRPPQ